MPRTRESGHFLPADKVPTIDEDAPLQEVYKRLKQEGRSAFVLTRQGQPKRFVRADRLGTELGVEAASTATDVSTRSVGEALEGLATPGLALDIENDVLDADEPAPDWSPEERARRVEEGGELAGWHLSNETMVAAVETPPDVWHCEPHDHTNYRYNDGLCIHCGGRLIS